MTVPRLVLGTPTTPESVTWRQHAACRGQTAAMYPADLEGVNEARSICATCPVTTECDDIGQWEPYGVWAGRSERERLVARRGKPRPPTAYKRPRGAMAK